MNDAQIRNILINEIKKKYRSTDKQKNVIVQEMALCKGFARIDVALVNGTMHGYEIKSAEDTLNRLENQVQYYSKCFDYITVVASEKHIDSILSRYPSWLGVSTICSKKKTLSIKSIRPPSKNTNVDIVMLLHLLWKGELLTIGHQTSQSLKFKYFSKTKLIANLVQKYGKQNLKREVRNILKKRSTWKVAQVV